MSETTNTGAVRDKIYAQPDNCEFPPRYDLISTIGLQRLAVTYGEGAQKYGDDNWRKGFTDKCLIQHVYNHLEQWRSGDRTEDHLGHAAWGLFTLMHNERVDLHHPLIDDLFQLPYDADLLFRSDRHTQKTVAQNFATQVASDAPSEVARPTRRKR